jgi:hypothetical protein
MYWWRVALLALVLIHGKKRQRQGKMEKKPGIGKQETPEKAILAHRNILAQTKF